MIFSRKCYLNVPKAAVLASLLLLSGMSASSENPAPKLEEMTVVASRTKMPLRQVGASVSVLTSKDLEQKSFPSLAGVLRTLPSVTVTQSGGLGKTTGVRIRGEEAYRTLVLIDGIKVSDVSTVQAMPRFGHMLNGQLGRVEVLRGPQGMMYGADAGGVISIFSKQSDELFEGDLSAEGGRYDSYRAGANLRGTVKRLKYSLTASDLNSNGFNARVSDFTEDTDGYENTTLHGTAEVRLTESSGVGLVLRDTDGSSQFDGCGWPTSYNCLDEYQQSSGKLDWHYHDDQQRHELAYMLSTTENVNSVVEQGTNALDNKGEIEQWEYIGHYAVAKDLSFVFGADYEINSYINNLNPQEFERDQTGVFAEGQVSFGDQFFYTVGARYDDNEDFGEHTSYRLTAAYLVPVTIGEIKLRGSYGTGFRAPSLYELGYNNRPITPAYVPRELTEEMTKGYEFGVEWRFAIDTFMEVVWFDSRIEDEIFFDLVAFGGYLQSAGETESRGVEFNALVEVIDKLILGANYTYNDTALSEDTTLVGAQPGDQRARRPKHSYNLSMTYSLWQDRINLAAFYRSSRDAVDYVYGAGRVPLDDYSVLDITGSWQVNESLETYLRWQNALDEEYQQLPGYNTSGSAAYAGVRVHF